MSLHVAVLAASGKTGQELVRQALERGHTVNAIARNIDRIPTAPSDSLRKIAADARDIASIHAAVRGADLILSALGSIPGEASGILTVGAAALTGTAIPIVWLGAFGTGRSAFAAGALTRSILKLALRGELEDKRAADEAILAIGGTVMHVGPLTDGPRRDNRRFVLSELPRQLFARPISRSTVAKAMLDEAEGGPRSGEVVVVIPRR